MHLLIALLVGFSACVCAQKSLCPGHSYVYSVLSKYTSGAAFCSSFLPITPATVNVVTTSTGFTTTTTTVTTGTTTIVASALKSNSTVTITRTVTPSATVSKMTSTVYTTKYFNTTQTTVNSACSQLIQKRSLSHSSNSTSSSKSIPSALSMFSPSALSAGCSCLSLPTSTTTLTSVSSTSMISTVTINTFVATTTTPMSFMNISTTVLVTPSAANSTASTVYKTVTVNSTSTVAVAKSAPTKFYLESSNGYYVSLAPIGGGMYLTTTSTAHADLFNLTNTNLLQIATNGSRYAGDIAVGMQAVGDYSNEWFHIVAKKSGARELCCSVTSGNLLSCDYGQIFGYCYEGQLWEGSEMANTTDYYYSAYACQAITLQVVAA